MTWGADVWTDGKRWFAQYTAGPGILTSQYGPIIDSAKTREKLDRKIRRQLASLNPVSYPTERVESGEGAQ